MSKFSELFNFWYEIYKDHFIFEEDLSFENIKNKFKECVSIGELAEKIKKGDHKSGDIFYFNDICLMNISSPHLSKPDTKDGDSYWGIIRGKIPCGVISVKLAFEWHGKTGVFEEIMEVVEAENIEELIFNDGLDKFR